MPACRNCGAALEPGARVCPACRTLVHADELERLSAEARALESRGRLADSRSVWTRALALLPPDTTQARWIHGEIHRLHALDEATTTSAAAEPQQTPTWVRRLGPLGPVAVALLKGKALLSLLNLKFLLSLGAFLAVYWSMFGFAFGAGFVAQIVVHEMGHYVAIRRRGLPAEMPVFLPGLGAYVKWRALGVSAADRAAISLAGPLAGAIASGACLWIGGARPGLWSALAHTGAWLNALNLIPIWIFDGSQAASAIDRSGRVTIALVSVALWMAGGESVFLFVAAGAVWRAFETNQPAPAGMRPTASFVVLLAGLALLLFLAPDVAARP